MYETLKTLCPHGYHYSGFVVAYALGHMILLLTIYIVLPATFLNALLVHQYKQRVIVHHVLLYMSYYKPTVVITGRAYRFHDFMIYNTHHASARLWTFFVVDHLWKLIFCFLLSFLSIFLIHWNQHCIIVHHISKYINCYKAIVVMTQRVHCFHGFIYTLRSFCFCKA